MLLLLASLLSPLLLRLLRSHAPHVLSPILSILAPTLLLVLPPWLLLALLLLQPSRVLLLHRSSGRTAPRTEDYLQVLQLLLWPPLFKSSYRAAAAPAAPAAAAVGSVLLLLVSVGEHPGSRPAPQAPSAAPAEENRRKVRPTIRQKSQK